MRPPVFLLIGLYRGIRRLLRFARRRHILPLMTVSLVLVFGVVVGVLAFSQHRTDKASAPIKQRMQSALVASDGYLLAAKDFRRLSLLRSVIDSGHLGMKTTLGVARSAHELSLATDPAGQQLVLVTQGIGSCMAAVENIGAVSDPLPNTPATAGTYYSLWVVPDSGCTAADVPHSGIVMGPHWGTNPRSSWR